MSSRAPWALGVVVFVLALASAAFVALSLPLGYDSRAYWLAAQHLVGGERLYAQPDATLGTPDEFHYLPIVAMPFVLLLPMPIDVAVRAFFVIELALAGAVGYALIRPLPPVAKPWAAAAYVFFLPMVLEVTLGNVDLLSLALALLAWHWRERLGRSAFALAAAVGLKFLPLILLPFYIAAGRGRVVLRAFLVGVVALVVTLPLLWRDTLDYLELLPRYADPAWARTHLERETPDYLANLIWTDAFAIALALAALGCGIACGRMAQRDPSRETEWHHIALALAPYLAPFGFFWTTFLITSLPLFAITLPRALALP
ncbi:MAG TPA: glycosyltransferase 87 family protein, partial [Candidatus Limnocylindrales bacterium]|nr:glycosyltransferase 87 family protein [Candidatus Limnocylindrales bacterium]